MSRPVQRSGARKGTLGPFLKNSVNRLSSDFVASRESLILLEFAGLAHFRTVMGHCRTSFGIDRLPKVARPLAAGYARYLFKSLEFLMGRSTARLVLLVWTVALVSGCSIVDPVMNRLTVLSGAYVIPEERPGSVPANHSDASTPSKPADANIGSVLQ